MATTSANTTTEGELFFGGWLPERAATSHFFIVGTTGSGKTLTFTMLMKTALEGIRTNPNLRAVVFDVKQDILSICHVGAQLRQVTMFDVKQDILSILPSINVSHSHIGTLNPFDQRCYEWDMAADIDAPDTALQVATIFIPEDKGQNRYFTDAARDLLAGVMNVFIQRGDSRKGTTPEESGPAWRLADLILAFRSPSRLKHVLRHTQQGRDLIELHLQGDATTASVLSTARTRLAPFEVIAALWKHAGDPKPIPEGTHPIMQAQYAPRKISLHQFLKSNFVLVLGNNQAALAPIQAINRVIFQRLTELVLDGKENPKDGPQQRTWFFLDEARKLGKLDGLDDLLTNGRSKGVACALGFQDIDGMRAVYGPEIAGELTTMCASFGVLKTAGVSTPKWASELFGEREETIKTRNASFTNAAGHISATEGENEQIRKAPLYLPSEFTNVPRPQPGQPLIGYFRSSFYAGDRANKGLKVTIPPPVLDKLLPDAQDDALLNFKPWPHKRYKYLLDWNAADYARLHLVAIVVAPPKEDNKGAQGDKGQQMAGIGEEEDEENNFKIPEPREAM